MKMKKIVKWLVLGSLGVIIAFVAVMVFAIVGPRPDAVEGTDRPNWLPVTATDIFYRSQEGFGWWKEAEFTISESDFRAFAAKEGWSLTEEADFSRPGHLELIRPKGRELTENEFRGIPHALVFERRASNNGGITVAFDPLTSKAYYSASHR